MPIHFPCPNCGKRLKAPAEASGRKSRCPTCGTISEVPSDGVEHATAAATGQDAAAPFVSELPGGSDRHAATAAEGSIDDLMGGLGRGEPVAYRIADAESARAESGSSWPFDRRDLEFEGRFTPNIRLLATERVVDTFEAGVWDLGPFGWLCGFKVRLVLTTHRLIRFDKRILDNLLQIVWLPAVRTVTVGQEVRGFQAMLGILVLTVGLSLILWTVAMMVWGRDTQSGVLENRALGLGAVMFILGVVLIVFARRKVLIASTGSDRLGLRLGRIASEESKRFVDKIFLSLNELRSTTKSG